jgi:hypothetical protein
LSSSSTRRSPYDDDDDDDDDSDDDDSQRSASFNAGAGIACCAPWSTGPGMRHLRWIAAERVTGA